MVKLRRQDRFRSRVSASVMIASVMVGCASQQEQAAQPQALPVKLQTLQSATLIKSSQYVGQLQARQRVNLSARVDGRIIKIYVNDGQTVKAGQPIVALEPTRQQENVNAATSEVNVARANLSSAEAEYRQSLANLQANDAEIAESRATVKSREANVSSQEADLKRAQANLVLARKNYERARFLVEEGAQAQQDLDDELRNIQTSRAEVEASRQERDAAIANLQAAREGLNISIQRKAAGGDLVASALATVNSQKAVVNRTQAELGATTQELDYQTVRAPIDGVVSAFDQLKVGDFVNPGDTITNLINNQTFDLNINVPTEQRARLRVGLPVEIINSDGSAGTKGKVTFIAPLATQSSQTFLVKMTFKNDGTLSDSEYVRVRVIWEQQPGVLVPTTAVTSVGAQNFVFVAQNAPTEDEKSTQEGQQTQEKEPITQKGEQSPNLIVRQRPIQVGTIQGQAYQVVSGVKVGDKIAVSRILDLRDGTRIVESDRTVSSK